MKKLTISLCILGFALTAKAQVGVNTTNPRGVFNVDGAKNNTNTTTPATVATESTDDVVVDATGKVGIGTSTPTQKLDIEGSAHISTQIYDGNNAPGANGQVISSDGTKIKWVNNIAITPAVLATLSTTSNTITLAPGGRHVYTGSYLELPAGKWSVQVTMLLSSTTDGNNGVVPDGEGYWVRSFFSDTNINHTGTPLYSPDYIGSPLISGSLIGPTRYSLLTGTVIINNTSGAKKKYYYFESNPEWYGNGVGTYTLRNFGTSLWQENQIVAYPMN